MALEEIQGLDVCGYPVCRDAVINALLRCQTKVEHPEAGPDKYKRSGEHPQNSASSRALNHQPRSGRGPRRGIEPRLEHQHCPQLMLPVSSPREMLTPFPTNRRRIEITFGTQS